MKRVTSGDTIDFLTTVNDVDDNAIEDATVTLQVYDSTGSLVLDDVIDHDTDGTYVETKSTNGWANGAIRQQWTIESSSGTKSLPVENEIRIASVGATTQTYVDVGELEDWFPSIVDYLDNRSEDRVISAYKYQNRLLDSLGYPTPLNANSDGFYDQSARDFNAWDAIYRIVEANQVSQVQPNEDGEHWYDKFKKNAMGVYDDWKTLRITFKNQVSPSEAGIGPSTKTVGTSAGTMFTNSAESYGSGFEGSDFQRDWSVEITGTGTSGELRECEFKWSNTGGLDYGTLTTSDAWIHLSDQCYVRFNRGTETGTANIFAVGDKWTWKTNPVRNQVGGKYIATGY